MTTCCDACLRHAYLIAHLAPRIAGMLDRPRERVSGVLKLDEQELIDRVAPNRVDAVRQFVEDFDRHHADARLAEREVVAICRHHDDYPEKLRDLTDPPRVLFCAGPLERLRELIAEPAATIVGSRRASPYALEVARQLGRGLAASGVTVVSGLALGIDAASHEGALEGGGQTIAVLACGPDVVYPSSHRALYRRLGRSGVVLSEMPPGTRALKWGFPARNRIMAALGAITVVVEAGDPSGSLITANFAADLGRSVGAVPGRVTVSVAEGSNRLLRDGAALIRGPEDVLDEIFGVGNRALSPAVSDSKRVIESLLPNVRKVLERVELGESVSAIAEATGLGVAEVRAAIGQLEHEGLIVPGALGWWERAPRW
jgi:DNA processing protein